MGEDTVCTVRGKVNNTQDTSTAVDTFLYISAPAVDFLKPPEVKRKQLNVNIFRSQV